MEQKRNKRRGKPLDEDGIAQIALRYVARYATTEAKLADYLERKLAERGWSGETRPDIARIVRRMADAGYVDDTAYAAGKVRSLTRRGYGARRIDQALRGAGLSDSTRESARLDALDARRAAAERFAQRRKIGAYAEKPTDRATREKQLASFLRAGHDFDIAREFVESRPCRDDQPDG